MCIEVKWLEYSPAHDKGPTGDYRAFKVNKEVDAVVLSHLVLKELDMQPVKSRSGRVDQGFFYPGDSREG